jgi:hypothetical protein
MNFSPELSLNEDWRMTPLGQARVPHGVSKRPLLMGKLGYPDPIPLLMTKCEWLLNLLFGGFKR